MHLSTVFGKGGDAWMLVRSLWTDPWNAPLEREINYGEIQVIVRRRTSDRYVLREVFEEKTYGDAPRGIVFDLGANIGAFSLYAGQAASQVFAFEPESTNFAQLEKNVALNNGLPIRIFKKAVGGENAFATLHHATLNKGASSLVHKRSSIAETVEVVTLERMMELCDVSHIDFLKVDIEGSEYALFENAPLETLQRIESIAIETHHVRGKHVTDLVHTLERAGFTVRHRYTRLSPFGMHMLHAQRDV